MLQTDCSNYEFALISSFFMIGLRSRTRLRSFDFEFTDLSFHLRRDKIVATCSRKLYSVVTWYSLGFLRFASFARFFFFFFFRFFYLLMPSSIIALCVARKWLFWLWLRTPIPTPDLVTWTHGEAEYLLVTFTLLRTVRTFHLVRLVPVADCHLATSAYCGLTTL